MSEQISLEDRLFKGQNAPLHPIRITTVSGILTVPALIGLGFNATASIAPPLIALSYIGDALDGVVARRYGNSTKQGAIIDPYMDKFRNILIGSYILGSIGFSTPLLSIGILANFTVDIMSQKKRGNLLKQTLDCIKYTIHPEKAKIDTDKKSDLRANKLGKRKTIIQAAVNLGFVSTHVYLAEILNKIPVHSFGNADHLVNYAFGTALVTSAVLGYKGLKKRVNGFSGASPLSVAK